MLALESRRIRPLVDVIGVAVGVVSLPFVIRNE
jgi:hypothetical protein